MTRPRDIPLQCACGTVKAVARELSPATVNRVVCHCTGCRTYAHALGMAEAALDEREGTDLIMISPRQLELRAGVEAIGSTRMTPKGALRWYARCCHTPLANTFPAGRLPFMSIHHRCLSPLSDQARAQIFGTVRARVNGAFAPAEARALHARRRDLAAMLAHFAPLFFRWWLRGDARRSPLFDGATLQPLAAPEPLPRAPLTFPLP